MGFLKLAVFFYLALGLVYVLVLIYARSVERERLERDYDDGGVSGDRDAHIRAGLARWNRSLGRRLLVLVFVIPTLVVGVLVWALNFD